MARWEAFPVAIMKLFHFCRQRIQRGAPESPFPDSTTGGVARPQAAALLQPAAFRARLLAATPVTPIEYGRSNLVGLGETLTTKWLVELRRLRPRLRRKGRVAARAVGVLAVANSLEGDIGLGARYGFEEGALAADTRLVARVRASAEALAANWRGTDATELGRLFAQQLGRGEDGALAGSCREFVARVAAEVAASLAAAIVENGWAILARVGQPAELPQFPPPRPPRKKPGR
jgi:hypothetical protein